MYEEDYGSNKGFRLEGRKRGYKPFFLFERCFASNRSAESTMDFGAEIIGMVRINTKGFCKDSIYNMTKDWPGGYYFVLKRILR